MTTLDPSTLPPPTPTVTFDPKSDTVTLPGGVVSVAGATVITGGVELSCGSCMLAFGVWGTLIGLSMAAVGLWDQSQQSGSTSHLLALGLVVLAISSGVVAGVFGFRFLARKRGMMGGERDEGKVVLVGERGRSVIKTVTV